MAEKEQVIQALRATLLSVKGALTLKQCNRDYKELQGEWIPFKKLGYPSLEKLFLDVSGFKVSQVNGEWYVDAIASQETQHIAAMVARQKPSKKSGSKVNYLNRLPKKQGIWRKPASNNTLNYGSQYSNQYYRAKSGAPLNNNSYNNYKNVKPNNTHKTIETKNNSTIPKQPTKTATTEYSENTATKSSAQLPQLRSHSSVSEEHKQSARTGKDIENKSSGKVSASQRLSNLRDRLSTVDLIPLQLPAANNEIVQDKSDPVTNVVPAHKLEAPPDCTSSVAKLEWTCRKLGLPSPVYKVQNIGPKRGPASYDSTVKVGASYVAMSYPNSSPSEELAKEVAAVKLLELLESSETEGVPTSSPTKAMSSLVDLVSEHEAGLWASTVPFLYRKKYGENLPTDWQDLVENCPFIVIDRVANGLSVLLLAKEGSLPLPVDTSVFDEAIESDLPPLQFPEDDFWNVFITVANSTLEIWLRIIGPQYSDAFETLLADMAKYYDSSGTAVDKSMIIRDAWYAVNLDDGGWQRAKIMDFDEETASVFLGDHGDDDVVALNKIRILDSKFRKLPPQAILCRLEGVEELAASAAAAELVRRRLPGEVLVAAPGARTDPTDPSIALVLYDTSTQRDLNLNKEIVHDFCISGAFSITQKPCEVEVKCVTEEGRVWVSAAGGADTVRAALALLTAGPYRRQLPAAPFAPSPNAATLYIVRTLAGDWVRCTIISGLDGEGTVRTQLVDSGLILRAPLSSLVPLQTFSPALNAYPFQAMLVRLGHAERAAAAMVSRLRELVLDQRVLCRALPGTGAASSAPHVELFVRTEPQNMLASVNNDIFMEHEYLNQDKVKEQKKDTPNPVEALNKKKERLYRTASGADERPERAALPPPTLPSPGQCFDVYVAMAANPWNFVVQPNSTRHMLQTMMSSLQIECPKLSQTDAPLKPANGELYTVYYAKDLSWYRVTVAGSVSSEIVSVYFCDYGDLALFEIQALRPVPPTVPLARTLPPQAIKARLYDVLPLHQDWAVEDCIRFQELCVDQQYVGICKDVGKDPLNTNEPLLTLELIDTSTDEDVYLNKQLVSEGRARLASAT
ncbi:tudor domain-containing protein 7 isoform X1 [Bombyx mori]|uniref:Tudor domain-containing protein 7 n=1 Tax=Bombyx mori TaxID=7091 RepID=A0A8R2C856_BOMMO|nr:tudor domain-containing protein 7 isoform X1 [Bombyx mori]